MRDPSPFGKYVLLERISVGGMAEVFKAKSFGVEGFEKIVAIKRILPSLAEDNDFIEMFIDEAKICGQINHANICQIFELGRVGDAHFIAMEFVWGKDLLQMQNRFRKLRKLMAPSMAAFIGLKMCEGLDYAHKKKDSTGKPLHIIHRDVSPQNILVSYEGEVKIIDFGIAKAATRSSKTQAGVLKGKFGYMSPEQVRGLPLDRRSDIFSIGTILYELLIADRLFVGESDFETLERVRNVDVPPITKTNPSVPPPLEQILLKALAKDVEDRYQWSGEMQADLQTFLNSVDPTFGEKQLSTWMREQFAVELKREQDVLDSQRKVGREMLTPRPVAPVAARPSVAPLPVGGLDPSALFEGAEADAGGGLHAEKTTVTGPTFMPEANAPLSAQSTQIVASERALLPKAGISVSRTPAGAADTPLRAESTVILGDSSAPRPSPAVPKIRPEASTMLAMQAPVLPAGVTPLFGPVNPVRPPPPSQPVVTPVGAGQVVAPPVAGRAPLWRDMLIGIGVAAAMIVAIFGARAFLAHGAPHGTLVVTLNASASADVRVDGEPRGTLRPQKPLTLKDLAAGDHALVVRAADGAEWRQVVSLTAGDVSVVTAELHQPAAAAPAVAAPAAVAPAAVVAGGPGTGLLTLRVPAEAAQVYVDGSQLPEGAWRQPIALRADVSHDLRVASPGRADVKLSVTLKAGEQLSRDVELSSLGKVHIITDPEGAEIAVNGRRSGVSPVSIGEIETGKPVRLTVRHRGFAPIIKYVNFDKGLEQNFEFKMVTSADDGYASAEAGESDKPSAGAPKGPRPLIAESADDRKSKDPAAALMPMSDDAPKNLKDAPKPSTEPGFLVANTQPWAKVIIDGKDTGKTTPIAPRSKIALKPGKHVVTFVANGKKFNFDVTIRAAEDTRLIKQLTE